MSFFQMLKDPSWVSWKVTKSSYNDLTESLSYYFVAMEIITGDDPDVNVLHTYLIITQKEQWWVMTL